LLVQWLLLEHLGVLPQTGRHFVYDSFAGLHLDFDEVAVCFYVFYVFFAGV
jgi:hypothetical protein